MSNPNVRLVTCLLGDDDDDDDDDDDEDDDGTRDGKYCFFIDGKRVKYTFMALGTSRKAENDRTFESILLDEHLPPLATRDWNHGHAGGGPRDGEHHFLQDWDCTISLLPSQIGAQLVKQIKAQRSGSPNTHPRLRSKGRCHHNYCQTYWVETASCKWNNNSGIGSFFLGHTPSANTTHA